MRVTVVVLLVIAMALCSSTPPIAINMYKALQESDVPTAMSLLRDRGVAQLTAKQRGTLLRRAMLGMRDPSVRMLAIQKLVHELDVYSLLDSVTLALSREYIQEAQSILVEVRGRLYFSYHQRGVTPLMLAIHTNNLILEEDMARIRSMDEAGDMATHYAAKNAVHAYNREMGLESAHRIWRILSHRPEFTSLLRLPNNAGLTAMDIVAPVAQRQHAEVPQPYTTFTGNEPECPICLDDIDASSPVVELVHPWTPGTYAPRYRAPQEKPHLFHTACLREHTRLNGNSDGVTFDPEARTYFYKWTRQYGDAV